MKSVFNTAPPTFSISEIINFIQDNYNINGNLKELYSDRDQIFLVDSNEKKFILKISNPAEEYSVIDLQDKAAEYIIKNDPSMKIPRRVGPILRIEKNRKKFYIRLLNYIEGTLMSEKKLVETSYKNMGSYIGRLSNNLKGFEHSGAYRVFDWDIRQIDLIKEKIQFISDESGKKIIHHFIDKFEENIEPYSEKLRTNIIHNDGNDHNILVDKKSNTIGIIDFGDMVYSYQAIEPAVCMAYAAMGTSDVFLSITSVLKNYNAVYKLNDFELKAVIYLLCLRLCVTVLMASWRKKLFPNNHYLSISETSAWRLLKTMEKEELKERSRELSENAI